MKIKIAPSLLSADFSCLREDIRQMEDGGADLLHLDVMDGNFVPNITFGPPLVKTIRQITRLFLEAHLMIADPKKFLQAFAEAGADRIIIHAEAVPDANVVLDGIKKLGKQAGVSLKPKTSLDTLVPFPGKLDSILIMTVEPGFGGQAFMPEMLPKIKAAREIIEQKGLDVDVAVDGGIDPDTAPQAIQAGANVLIAGNAIFKEKDRADVITRLRQGQ